MRFAFSFETNQTAMEQRLILFRQALVSLSFTFLSKWKFRFFFLTVFFFFQKKGWMENRNRARKNSKIRFFFLLIFNTHSQGFVGHHRHHHMRQLCYRCPNNSSRTSLFMQNQNLCVHRGYRIMHRRSWHRYLLVSFFFSLLSYDFFRPSLPMQEGGGAENATTHSQISAKCGKTHDKCDAWPWAHICTCEKCFASNLWWKSENGSTCADERWDEGRQVWKKDSGSNLNGLWMGPVIDKSGKFVHLFHSCIYLLLILVWGDCVFTTKRWI